MKSQKFAVRLNPADLTSARRIAESRGSSVGAVIRQAVAEYVRTHTPDRKDRNAR